MPAKRSIYLGQLPLKQGDGALKESFIEREGDLFYKLENYPSMDPFFMTITSDTNHWMFISSTGGLTAGRINSESALFPYYTDDKIEENAGNTGPATKILVEKGNKTYFWQPFAGEGAAIYDIQSSLYKNIRGNIIEFEELNKTLGLSFSYSWMNSRKYGWIRKSVIGNLHKDSVNIEMIDGLRNILPAGTASRIQNTFGNLLNAYKKSEIDGETGLGIFALSATLTDLAEPSESLKANTLWSCGIEPDAYILGARQFDDFPLGEAVKGERENKGERGNYFVHSAFPLGSEGSETWYISADVDRDHSHINNLKAALMDKSFNGPALIEEDVRRGSSRLDAILAQNDGFQSSGRIMNCVHHQANVLYNIMRGGYFYRSYRISLSDLTDFFLMTNKAVAMKYETALKELGEETEYGEILSFIEKQKDGDLLRLWYEYLPLTFSRRHGDPSRPWNVFSIETEKADGSAKLDYQGNWRDIFQNWEALGYSYPLYIRHFIGKFLNATTADGYNPYRISRAGIDWEVPEPGNPWANIGYWSDHQIIYLLKILEMHRHFFGDALLDCLNDKEYTFADVPYEIKSFDEILKDPYVTILFNEKRQREITARAETEGAEGKMLHQSDGSLIRATMTEKLLVLLLAKLGNFIPGGGIWMNTQRPEWNDANNALVGKGISVVTLAYVRRFIAFLIDLYGQTEEREFSLNRNIAGWFRTVGDALEEIAGIRADRMSPEMRFDFVRALGEASGRYRSQVYSGGFSAEANIVEGKEILDFLKVSLRCVDDSLKANKREDDLYHSYNTIETGHEKIVIHYLYEMLEGQVAILSSGLLSGAEVMKTLDAIKSSALYREDQNSYMLYPDRRLPSFLDKNNIDPAAIEELKLLKTLLKEGNRELISGDERGLVHFNGDFHNVRQVRNVLNNLKERKPYRELVDREGVRIERLFEETFNHQSFTGRSGTFFAYEGLGSIYWHMVSKLLLAVQENLFGAVDRKESPEVVEGLKAHYYDVRSGIGYNKPAEVYGAFPFEPYSHTPAGKGARQPGMTGQVKEEVITRLAETGIRIEGGKISVDGTLIDRDELHREASFWTVRAGSGESMTLDLPEGTLGATFCGIPFIVSRGDDKFVRVHFSDDKTRDFKGTAIPEEICGEIYGRSGKVKWMEITV